MSAKLRIELEKKIFTKACVALISAGYHLRLNDGEATTTPRTQDIDVLLAAQHTTDEDYIFVYTNSPENKNRIGWLHFVYGNCGWDVLSDYTTNLEDVLKPVNDFANTYS